MRKTCVITVRRRLLVGLAVGIVPMQLLPACAAAQVRNFEFPRMGGSYYAAAFSQWHASTSTPVEAPGLATVQVTPARITLVASDEIAPAMAGVPVRIEDGAASETVTPFSVDCSVDACAMTATFAFAHLGGFTFSSGTGGLDEAISAAAGQGGGTVVIGSGWSGSTAQITGAAGSASVLVLDRRNLVHYRWNGTSYQPAPTISSVGEGASGSGEDTTAACSATSAQVTLAAAMDFTNGNGIALSGCGAAAFGGAAITPPTPTIINWCGANGQMACATAPGSTPYSYRIVVDDGHEGTTAASPVATTSTGAARLGPGDGDLVEGANYLTWDAPAGISTNSYGYFVYAQANGGAWRLIGLETIPGTAEPWTASTIYANGRMAEPVAAPNGSYYVATIGGTSGASEPAWCVSSSTCTVVDGTVTWQRQPFSWMDTAQTVTYAPAWVPTTPPAAGAADVLVTTVTSGGGSTSLTLASAAGTSAAAAYTTHDDTAALNAALAAQLANCDAKQPFGFAPQARCPLLTFANGQYNVTGPVNFGQYLNVQGDKAGWVYAEEPFQNIFTSPNVTWLSWNGVHTTGGRTALFVGVAAGDATFTVEHADVQMTTGYALDLDTQATQSSGVQMTIQGTLSNDRGALIFAGDWLEIEPNSWVSMTYPNTQPYQAQIVNLGATLSIHGVFGVPQSLPYDRWVDLWANTSQNGDYSSALIDDSRIGSEGAGMSAVYVLGGYGASQAFNWPLATVGLGTAYDRLGMAVTIRDSLLGAGAVTLLNNTFPQQLTLSGNYASQSAALVNTCSGINVFTRTSPCALPAGFSPTNLDTVLEGSLWGADTVNFNIVGNQAANNWCLPGTTQPDLLPYLTSERCLLSAAAPTNGVWTTGGSTANNALWEPMIRDNTVTAGSPLGWLLEPGAGAGATAYETARAAPPWQENHTYTLATSPFGEGDDFVAATVGGTAYSFYVSAVSSGTTCTSGASTPSWSATFNTTTGVSATTPDGTCTWSLETVGSQQWWLPGYIAPFAAEPVAQFLQVGAIGPVLPLSASVAGSTTSLAGGTCGDAVTVAVSGAQTTMSAVASGEAALPSPGLTLEAAVTSAGVVTVEYCNLTAAAIVPAPLTVAVRVVRP
ncbi:MAG: hypothetical protein ACRD1C_03800 [Terriglobales bacterium]